MHLLVRKLYIYHNARFNNKRKQTSPLHAISSAAGREIRHIHGTRSSPTPAQDIATSLYPECHYSNLRSLLFLQDIFQRYIPHLLLFNSPPMDMTLRQLNSHAECPKHQI